MSQNRPKTLFKAYQKVGNNNCNCRYENARKFKNKGRERKDMTLIIGARCSDGVVLIGDKKVTEGTTSFQDKKIIIMPFGVAISGAGMGDFSDKFGIKLKNHINNRAIKIQELKDRGELPQDAPLLYVYIDDFVTDCETILVKLKEDYRDTGPQLHLLMGFRNDNKAELHFLDMEYGVDSIRKSFMTIGSGSPYANFFLRELWNENLTMKQMAKIGVFIINYISEKRLDDAVGYGYQIVEIPDLVPNMEPGVGDIKEVEFSEEEKIEKIINEFHKKVKELKDSIC